MFRQLSRFPQICLLNTLHIQVEATEELFPLLFVFLFRRCSFQNEECITRRHTVHQAEVREAILGQTQVGRLRAARELQAEESLTARLDGEF